MRKPCFLLSAWCVYLETSFRKKIRAGEARMIFNQIQYHFLASPTFSFLAANYKHLREMSLPRVADNRACARFAHIIFGECSPCVTETIFAYPFVITFVIIFFSSALVALPSRAF